MGWPEYQTIIPELAMNTALRVGNIQNTESCNGRSQTRVWKVLTPPKKPSDYAVVFKITGV